MSEKPTVFIIDDDATARDSLAALVRSMSIALECYGSAEDFLAGYSCSEFLACGLLWDFMGYCLGLEIA